METENHTFLQVLKVPHAELWYSRNENLVFAYEDAIQILYSQALNKFILRVNEFKIVLDKSVHIIGSIVGRHLRQAYLFPRGIGFTMIRLPNAKSTPALQNFETILENTTNFSQRSGLDPTLAEFKELREGGFTNSILKTFESVSKVIAPTVGDDSHPNQKIAREFKDLLDLDSHGTHIVDMADGELETLAKKNELDNAGFEKGELWRKFMGEGESVPRQTKESAKPSGESVNPSGDCDIKEGHQRTSDMDQPAPKTEQSGDKTCDPKDPKTCRYHASIDHQEIVGPQEQRLPSYEVHNSKEFLRKNLRKCSTNLQKEDLQEESQPEKSEENMPLPDPVEYDDEAFTIGLLTKDHRMASKVGSDKEFPIENEDAFKELAHPMRKFSSYDRPFLNIDQDTPVEPEKPKNEGHSKGFTGQPIITAKGQPTLKSNIDDQPSPISNVEKYSTEPTQPEKSSFSKSSDNGNGRELSSDAQPMQPSSKLGELNVIREASQGSETKKHKKISNEPVDKENLRSPTAI